MTTAQQVQVSAQMYRCRDCAKFVLGERYAGRMADYGGAIRKVATHLECSELQAATKLAGITDDGMTQVLIFAAAVELIDPSTQESRR